MKIYNNYLKYIFANIIINFKPFFIFIAHYFFYKFDLLTQNYYQIAFYIISFFIYVCQIFRDFIKSYYHINFQLLDFNILELDFISNQILFF